MSGFAIRFRSADPKRQDEPAMYLAAEGTDDHGRGKLTSEPVDVWSCSLPSDVESVAVPSLLRATSEGLTIDVVPLRDALADLGVAS